MGRTCSTYRQKKSTYKKLVGKPEEIRQLGRRKRRLEDILKKSSGVVRIEFFWLRIRIGGWLLQNQYEASGSI
jgi:hypothetical protein